MLCCRPPERGDGEATSEVGSIWQTNKILRAQKKHQKKHTKNATSEARGTLTRTWRRDPDSLLPEKGKRFTATRQRRETLGRPLPFELRRSTRRNDTWRVGCVTAVL